ncbi:MULTISPECIES: hypothetical protein [Oceanobacillus]|uniref:hypothetical protein n=1 Tax=Oceanobacillus TaxID=182709 RepID=UPI00117D3236|nr:hypothetical protein [Oceanobacillus profundus]MCM3398315.1 hypothetical protein [Oceanobacillus profundus]
MIDQKLLKNNCSGDSDLFKQSCGRYCSDWFLKQKQQEKQMEKILEKTSLSKVQFAVSWKVNLRHIENISNS